MCVCKSFDFWGCMKLWLKKGRKKGLCSRVKVWSKKVIR